jgi:precorrin-3B synthase
MSSTAGTSRGACPTLAEPMPVADGLLARLRPAEPLTPKQIVALARAADAFGNGRIEVTARGSVQVRGLSGDTEDDFREALDEAEIAAQTGVAIDISPLAGDDPKEIRDPRALAAELHRVCNEAATRGPLSPKLAIVLVSGGQVLLDGMKGDIRLLARDEGWIIEVGGQTLGAIAQDDIPDTIADVLARLQAIGPRARGTDLSGVELSARLDAVSSLPLAHTRPSSATMGPLSLKGGRPALRIGLPFGQTRPAQMLALAETMDMYGVTEARTAPDRSLILIGFDAAAMPDISPAIAGHGFWTRADAQSTALSICSGAEASPAGVIHASDLAYAMLAVMGNLIDGSFHLHVSTCTKGCAYAGRPGVVLEGNALTIYRGPAQKPFARLDPTDIEAGLVSLAARIRDSRRPGEATLDCLARLGA